jgi:membrane protein YdbS with pleckstrin-like domain
MARPDPLTALPPHRGLVRYLLDGEHIVIAAHQHWAKVAEPVASAAGGLVLVLVLDSSLPASLGLVANILWWAWFGLVGRAVWKLLERQHDWFVATDKRLILTYGLITRKVAMMPLTKVTDMSYNRSPLGRLLGYGTFVMESAGQDQALRTVTWVADPDHTYRAMCAEIFGVDDTTQHPTPIRIRPADSHPERSADREPDIRGDDTGPISY